MKGPVQSDAAVGLIDALHAAGPSGRNADELMLFGRLVGSWALEWFGPESATAIGELHFGWVCLAYGAGGAETVVVLVVAANPTVDRQCQSRFVLPLVMGPALGEAPSRTKWSARPVSRRRSARPHSRRSLTLRRCSWSEFVFSRPGGSPLAQPDSPDKGVRPRGSASVRGPALVGCCAVLRWLSAGAFLMGLASVGCSGCGL